MTAQKGKDLLLKIACESGYETMAGLRARRLQFNADTIDITDSQSEGQWRELLDGGGVRRAAISGDGIFKDAESDALLRETFFAGLVQEWQIVIPDFGTVTGPFQIVALEYGGQHFGEITFRIALESAGLVEFSAL